MQSAEYYRKLRQKRKESGLCIFCRKKVNNRVVCKECCKKAYNRNPEKYKERRRKYHEKNREVDNIKTLERMRKIKYGGMYYIIMERDNYTCHKCGKKEKLTIHHKDFNGSNSRNPNNSKDNLITLCNSCHGYLHRSLQIFIRHRGKIIICSECNKTKKLWNKKNHCCRSCYTKNHMYLSLPSPF